MNLNQSCGAVYLKFTSFVLILFLGGCAEQISTSSNNPDTEHSVSWQAPRSELSQRNFNLVTALWESRINTLRITGTSNNNGERITISNADSGDMIASTVTSSDLNWTLAIKLLAAIPCRIAVVSESGTITSPVVSAPANCFAGSNQSPLNTSSPVATIVSPETDLSIAINQSVNFEAAASNIVGTPHFNWRFNGVAQDSAIQNPGNIQFTKPGVYHITLDVRDSRGLQDPTPAMRMITVQNPVSVLTAQPIANIDTPMGDQVIMVGDTLNFMGSGSDPASNEVVTFMWNFDGISPNSTLQNPGDVVFATAGIFTVVLSVSDSVGNVGTSQIVVTVNDPNANQAPTGTITSPANDVMIGPGDSINVEGMATDPDANEPVTYLWEFDGVAPDSTMQNPGSITYPDPGTYTVRLTATDSLGLADPNPPVRVVTVQASGPVSSDLPNGEILTPAMDTTIMAGESITFTGAGTAPPLNEPLMFIWSFDGVAPNSTAMDSGPITFPNPGVYTVTLLVVDANFQTDPTPAVRVITVQDPNAVAPPPTMPAMVGHILTPETDVEILPGDSVNFSGVVDPEVNPPYTYLWLFDGAAPNAYTQSPGDVVFADPGMYSVMFFAIDKDGLFDTRPAVRTITATDPTTAPNLNPITSITNPDNDITINVGDTITFEGNVVDVSGNNTLAYLWSFDGAAPDDTALLPEPVTFSMAGTYEVTFSAMDTTTMLGSIQPATISITVVDPQPVNPASPVAEIINPTTDVQITVGESVIFEGSAVDSTGNGMLIYDWNFDGAADNANTLSPGPIVFGRPGRYNVTLTVFDLSDPTGMLNASATVSVRVNAGNGGPPQQPAPDLPQGIIVEPVGNQTIVVGDSIQFTGEGVNPIDTDPLNYVWDFGDGTTSTAQVPGIVTFNQVGVFTVTLSVDHDGIEFDPTPAEVVITVEAPGANDNDPPPAAP